MEEDKRPAANDECVGWTLRREESMARYANGSLRGSLLFLTLLVLIGSCAHHEAIHPKGPWNESGYEILSKVETEQLFRTLSSQSADVRTIQQFFHDRSFFLTTIEALRQGTRVACVVLYSATADTEHLGILAIKLQADTLVETTSGILWLTTGTPSFANEDEGPKVASTSAMSLCGWWNCVFRGSRGDGSRYGSYGPNPRRSVVRLEGFGFPIVYHWFRYCY